jgi:hypothetical protein
MSGLDEMIDAFHSLGTIDERTAKIAAPLLDQAVKQTAGAGQSPEGKPWAPTKTGRRAMANAASHIQTRAFGPVVKQTLTGPDVFHHYGTRGEPRRAVIPDAGGMLPTVVGNALDKASAQAFDELTSGAKS